MCVEAWSHMFLNPVNVGARYNVVCVCVCVLCHQRKGAWWDSNLY
jgi:hypothetical protein